MFKHAAYYGKILEIPIKLERVGADMGVEFILIWIVLLFFPVMALYWKRWVVFSIYALGCLVFLFTNLRDLDGWDGLAAVATLLVVVVPLYVLASLVWFLSVLLSRKKS